MKHLLVVWIIIKRHDWNPIIELERKRVNRVVNKHNVAQIPLAKNAEVLHVKIRIPRPHTARPIVPCLEVLVVRINIINYRVSVLLLARCKDNYLKVLVRNLQAVINMRPYVDSSHHGFGVV